jgi:hypothetical protein
MSAAKANAETKPAKGKKAPRKGPKGGGNKPNPSRKPGSKTPAWWNATKTNVAFVAMAGQLAQELKALYGASFSIAQFERMVAELPQLSEEHKSLLVIPAALLDLYQAYKGKKEARDSERESFRSFRSVEAFNAGLELAKNLGSPSTTDEEKKGAERS